MSIRLSDQDISRELYCYSQPGPVGLMRAHVVAAIQKEILFKGEEALKHAKAAYFMALIVSICHALEKGKKTPEVAKSFFNAADISSVSSEIMTGKYDEGMPSHAVSEKAKINAKMTATENLHLLFQIAHVSFQKNSFIEVAKLKETFKQTIEDNLWPQDFIDMMRGVFVMDLSQADNSEVDSIMAISNEAFYETIAMAKKLHGDYDDLRLGEYLHLN